MAKTQAGSAHRAGRSNGYQAKLNKSSKPMGSNKGGKYGGGKENNSGSSDADSGAMGSNHGATGGLKMSNEMRPDSKGPVSTDNPYPNGLA